MKPVERFVEFCSKPYAGFACFEYFDRNKRVKYIASIKHLLQDGAAPESLKKLTKWIDDPGEQVRDFYRTVDGAFLFVDAINGYRPFELCCIGDWHVATHEMRKWYLTKEAKFYGDIDFLTHGHAIARINQTPDYISIIAHGKNAGKIHLIAHDDFQYEPIANNFNEFVDQLIREPVSFLNDVGAIAHYTDGQSNTKWVPKEYVTVP